MNMYEICLLHARSDRALRAKVAGLLESSKITMMEWLLLGVVAGGSNKGMTMSEIAQSLHVTLPQVTALVNKLLPLKLIRQKSASNDRRSRLVTLTSKGELVLDENKKLLDAARKDIFGNASDDEVAAYIKLLTNLTVIA